MRFALLLSISLFLFSSFNSELFGQQAQTYESTLKSANEKFEAKDYISAKTYYEMALRLKPEDGLATKKLAETIALIKKERDQQEIFYQHLDQGDQLLKQGKNDDALAEYQKALQIFPNDKYVNKQVEQILEGKKAEKERKQQFEQHIQLSEKLSNEKKYDEALVQLNLALALQPDNKNVAANLVLLQQKLEEQNKLEAKCSGLMAEADNLRKRKNFAMAIEKMTEVQQLIPNWDDVSQKIAELQPLAKQQADFEQAIQNADEAYEQKDIQNARLLYEKALQVIPEEAYALDMIKRIDTILGNEKIEQQKAIEEALLAADRFVENKQYTEAIASCNKVLKIDPQHPVAKQKRTECEGLIAAELAAQKAQEQFDSLIASGDKAFEEKRVEEALSQYQKAQTLLPGNMLAQQKIADCRQQIAQQQEAEAIVAQYNTLIAQADAFFSGRKFGEAKETYENAQRLSPRETYPANQLAEIEKAMAEQANAEKIQKQYRDLVASADMLLSEKKYDAALSAYREAQILKAGETYAAGQVEKIEELIRQQNQLEVIENKFNELIAKAGEAEKSNAYESAFDLYTQASELKPEEALPKEKISRLQSQLNEIKAAKEKQETYNSFIAEADAHFSGQEFERAMSKYEQALALIPGSEYPQKQLKAVEKALGEQKASTEREEAYQQAIANADRWFEKQEYQTSIEHYQQALKLKPASQYPSEQIAQANKQLEAQEAAKQKELVINTLISEGEQLLINRKLVEAKEKFAEVLRLEPNHSYANGKSAEISLAIEAQEREREENYRAAMDEAEQNIAIKEYKNALSSLNAALGFKTNDDAALKRKKQVENIIEERLMALRSEYNKAVNEADRFYTNRSYDQAIEKYLLAEGIKPDESYPREMIKKIAALIEEHKIRELNTSLTLIPANTTKRFNFEVVDVTERRSNYILVKARNTTDEAFPLLVNFGSKSGRNGGFVLPIPKNDQLNDFIVKVGQQYKWFSEDNTWIEFLPENGAVEISLIQISRGEAQ